MAAEELEAAASDDATMTTSQTAVGALPYMAPEAIDTPKDVGSPADIWSLGAMVFHLMCGETPYGVGLRAVKAILAAERSVPPAFLTSNPQFAPLSNEIMELVYSCLQRDPDKRPTADDLVESCGNLCYTPALRRVGKIKRIKHGKWGFIGTTTDDVFFHNGSVYGPDQPQLNDHVLFSSFNGGGADRAHPVTKLN